MEQDDISALKCFVLPALTCARQMFKPQLFLMLTMFETISNQQSRFCNLLGSVISKNQLRIV